MTKNLEIRATDYHTAGEPFRIVTSGTPDIPGTTVPERREYRARHGTARHDRAGVWAVTTGRVAAVDDGDTDVVIDVPSGRVTARVNRRAGRVERVTFRNVPSYIVARDVPVPTSRGPVLADVSYGGAIYASVAAPALGLTVTPGCYADLIAVGREVKWALNDAEVARHPEDPRLSGIYGTILYEDLPATADGPHQRNADGEVDRSPCGSGTCARAALLSADGRLEDGQILTHDSIVGSRFTARIAERVTGHSGEAVVVDVEGNAFRTGEHLFVLDPRDAIGTGFVLR